MKIPQSPDPFFFLVTCRHMHAATCMQTHACRHMHADTCMQTHACSHMHADTCMQTHAWDVKSRYFYIIMLIYLIGSNNNSLSKKTCCMCVSVVDPNKNTENHSKLTLEKEILITDSHTITLVLVLRNNRSIKKIPPM